jgi:hypothetical protein
VSLVSRDAGSSGADTDNSNSSGSSDTCMIRHPQHRLEFSDSDDGDNCTDAVSCTSNDDEEFSIVEKMDTWSAKVRKVHCCFLSTMRPSTLAILGGQKKSVSVWLHD